MNLEYDFKKIESIMPKKIRRTRKRPNTSGLDENYIKNIRGTIKGKTVYLPGLTHTGKKKVANYVGNLCESITFGQTKSYFMLNAPIQDRQANALYRNVYEELKKLAKCLFPEFKYNNITLNHNFKCKPHIDSKNVGESIIIGFGEYENGELNVEGEKHNIRYKPFKFNGAEHEHWVEDFNGNRWTAVYFYKKI